MDGVCGASLPLLMAVSLPMWPERTRSDNQGHIQLVESNLQHKHGHSLDALSPRMCGR